MKIAFLGVPMALGADRIGVDKAPDCFRTNGAIGMMDSIAGCYDLGNVNSSIIAENIHASSPEVKYLNTVVDMATQLRDKVSSVIKQKYFPIVFSSKAVRQRGMNAVIDEIIEDMEKNAITEIHLSIDIDGMDPRIVCATGTTVPDGMNNSEFYTFLNRIFATGNVVSTDFVEYNPTLEDECKTTLKWCMEALHYLAIRISEL